MEGKVWEHGCRENTELTTLIFCILIASQKCCATAVGTSYLPQLPFSHSRITIRHTLMTFIATSLLPCIVPWYTAPKPPSPNESFLPSAPRQILMSDGLNSILQPNAPGGGAMPKGDEKMRCHKSALLHIPEHPLRKGTRAVQHGLSPTCCERKRLVCAISEAGNR